MFFLAVVQLACGGQWTGGFGPGALEECFLERLCKKGSPDKVKLSVEVQHLCH